MTKAALLLGTNLGDREASLKTARQKIAQKAGDIIRTSSIVETAPWGNENQQWFLNQAILVDTDVIPQQLLHEILAIELEMGRVRTEKWGPRIIDIDILYFDNFVIKEENLAVPHPHLQDRRFTLVPLLEISPDWVHPLLHKTAAQMLEVCPDSGDVHIFGRKE